MKEHAQMHGGRAEGDGERILSRPHAQHRAWHRAETHNREIMTWTEIQELDA